MSLFDVSPRLSENPLTLGMPGTLLPQPCILVIFGAAGDLSWRKLLPAVYNLSVDGVLPSSFAVVGFGIGSKGDPDEWLRARARDGITRFSRQSLDEDHWNAFSRCLFYIEGSFNDSSAYQHLRAKLETIDQQFRIPGSRVYYMSIPPTAVDMSVGHLKQAGMVSDPSDHRSFTRVIVEKPIGRDLESAREVNASLARTFAESQIYRIDHYLGKETVQNMLVLRFANNIFEPLWNKRYVDHVQITVAEEEGVGTRLGWWGYSGTWCRITCCRFSASLPWSRPTPCRPTWYAMPRWPCNTACGA
jgi:glucose-6-phosphate 1-dehydrogenase